MFYEIWLELLEAVLKSADNHISTYIQLQFCFIVDILRVRNDEKHILF